MASLAYNGSLNVLIHDITLNFDRVVLSNSGNSYEIYSLRELEKAIPTLLDNAEENNHFMYWYDCELI